MVPTVNKRIREIARELDILDPEGKFYSPNFEIFAEEIILDVIQYLEQEVSRLHGYRKEIPVGDPRSDDVDISINKCVDNIMGIRARYEIE
jgi:hypothetical protein